MTGPGNPYGALDGGDPYQGLDAEQRAKLDAAVVRMRTENDVRGAGGDLGPLEIDRSATTYTPPPAVPAAHAGETADEQVDRMLAEQAAAEVEDFSAFWAEQGGGKKLTGVGKTDADPHGVTLQLPKGLPLRFEMESKRLQSSERIEDVRYLFDMLYGAGTWDDLVDRGLDTAQLPVLLMWATQNLSGQPTTLAQAAAAHARMAAQSAEKDAAGNAPTPPTAGTSGATSAAAGH